MNEPKQHRNGAERASRAQTTTPLDVDAYIEAAPKASQPLLRELRAVIRMAAPQAQERISYGMPTYEQNGRVAYFAGYKNHVGLYAVIHEDGALADEAREYLENRSTLRFAVGKPLPVALIKKAIRERVKANTVGAGRSRST